MRSHGQGLLEASPVAERESNQQIKPHLVISTGHVGTGLRPVQAEQKLGKPFVTDRSGRFFVPIAKNEKG